MKWIAITAAVLAMAACGGGDGAESEPRQCYELVLNSKERGTVCNTNTDYELACLRKQYGVTCDNYRGSDYQCVYVRGQRVGVQFRTSCIPGQCYIYALDNPTCCDATNPGGVESWYCQ
ncbi:hypothetical protein MYXA107069_33020 [Myxococcus xanthus]|nr:hypothetical protein [Myxococcus xanthus]QZZ49544.1 hypothetical protein MyxoNM_10045 [Myxococcus xanthus]SDY27592.1 hypothetical protein SAMN05444383_1308 [Myxococcus xanthus]